MEDIKITIGLMVYNEEKYLKKSLEMLTSHDYGNCPVEIIIGDNASTDRSSEMINEFSRQDDRIKYIKRKKNIGAIENFNDIVKQAAGEYFVLAGGHDLWSSNYIKKLSSALDNNPKAVISFSRTQWIDEDDNKVDIPTSILDTSGMSGIEKFVSLMFANQHYLYGMIRTDSMKKTRLQKEIIGSGEIFLQELAQLGDFILVEGEYWYRRLNRKKETTIDRFKRYSEILFSSHSNKLKFKFFPMTQMMFHYVMLPFYFKNISIKYRLFFIFSYPLILFHFIKSFINDLKWLVNHK